uniref:Kazal-like domain-containing protein n=1 Tax=Pseudonaja textilis TaxID=8673 RepID=A0A670YR49_PSETE
MYSYSIVAVGELVAYSKQLITKCPFIKSQNIELLLQDECSIFAKPIEICPPKKQPVCSKQGVTYFNICALCHMKTVMPETALKHTGECKPE